MDQIICLSLSVKDGDAAEMRERATLSREFPDPLVPLKEYIEAARLKDPNASILYLETCHRVEIYAYAVEASDLENWWLYQRQVPLFPQRLRKGQQAIEHLIRVTSSLESEVIGETQITGQVKESAEACRKAGLLKGPLDRVLQQALRVAKKVRSLSHLGSGTVSVAHVAVDGLRDIFDSFEGKSALIVGAGSMAIQALERLESNGFRMISWVNRSRERIEAHPLAKRVKVASFEDLHKLVWQHSVTVVATSSSSAILFENKLKAAKPSRSERAPGPNVILDLGLPRNAEEKIRQLDGFFLRNVDEFKDHAERGSAKRREAIKLAEGILEQEIAFLLRTWNNWEKGPLLGELFKNVEASRLELLQEHFKLENFQEIDYILRGILSKMMHRLVEEVDGLEDTPSIQVLETLNRAWRPRSQWQQNAVDSQDQKQPQAPNPESPNLAPEPKPKLLKVKR
jgi:glutamyl-tRNA reductase